MRFRQVAVAILGVPALGALLSCPVLADGGAVRCAERRGNYQIVLFTQPAPLAVGRADVSVLVQNAKSREPLDALSVVIRAEKLDPPGTMLVVAATREAATNKLLRAAKFDLPSAGKWHLEATVQTPQGPIALGFDEEVAAGSLRWSDLAVWIGWPFVVAALFLVHQTLVRRGRRGPRLS